MIVRIVPGTGRVVHHALCNVIEPLFERTFIGDSYANRVGKGTHCALDRAQAWARQYRYVLQCDVEQFFPAIDHAVLRGDGVWGRGREAPFPSGRPRMWHECANGGQRIGQRINESWAAGGPG